MAYLLTTRLDTLELTSLKGIISLRGIALANPLRINQFELLRSEILPNTPNICLMAAIISMKNIYGLPLFPITDHDGSILEIVSPIVCGRIEAANGKFDVFAAAYQLDISSMWQH